MKKNNILVREPNENIRKCAECECANINGICQNYTLYSTIYGTCMKTKQEEDYE